MTKLNVVMYHYVRPIAGTIDCGIKGVEPLAFEQQLDHLLRFHEPVTLLQLRRALLGGGNSLPANAMLLTFDDGYIDHYNHVFPALLARKLEGTFFVPSAPICRSQVLEVNKIHFILARGPSPDMLVATIEQEIETLRILHGLQSLHEYRSKFWHASRYDGAEIVYVKKMLQAGLPVLARKAITDKLFRLYVTDDDADFVRQLYCSVNMLSEMQSSGMQIGGHGDQHERLSFLDSLSIESEIRGSGLLFDMLQIPLEGSAFSYPYGDYDLRAVKCVEEAGFSLGFAVGNRWHDPAKDSPLEIQRLDTTEFPYQVEAHASAWS